MTNLMPEHELHKQVALTEQPIPESVEVDELEQYTVPELLEFVTNITERIGAIKQDIREIDARCEKADIQLRPHFPNEVTEIHDLNIKLAELHEQLMELSGCDTSDTKPEEEEAVSAEEEAFSAIVRQEVKKIFRKIAKLTHPDKLKFLTEVKEGGEAEVLRRTGFYIEAKRAKTLLDLGTLTWIYAELTATEQDATAQKLTVIKRVRMLMTQLGSAEHNYEDVTSSYLYQVISHMEHGTRAAALAVFHSMLEHHTHNLLSRIAETLDAIDLLKREAKAAAEEAIVAAEAEAADFIADKLAEYNDDSWHAPDENYALKA